MWAGNAETIFPLVPFVFGFKIRLRGSRKLLKGQTFVVAGGGFELPTLLPVAALGLWSWFRVLAARLHSLVLFLDTGFFIRHS